MIVHCREGRVVNPWKAEEKGGGLLTDLLGSFGCKCAFLWHQCITIISDCKFVSSMHFLRAFARISSRVTSVLNWRQNCGRRDVRYVVLACFKQQQLWRHSELRPDKIYLSKNVGKSLNNHGRICIQNHYRLGSLTDFATFLKNILTISLT